MRTRTPAARAGIAVFALAALVALFVVLAGSDDDGTGSAAPRLQSATEPRSPSSATSQREARQRLTPTIERIVVRSGEVVGGTKRLEYESGERVRFSIRSDVADEVHVHGFDLTKDVSAQGGARFAFRADLEGVFDVELHHSEIEIAELRIKP